MYEKCDKCKKTFEVGEDTTLAVKNEIECHPFVEMVKLCARCTKEVKDAIP